MFKRCPACGHAWSVRNDFLSDPGLRVIGYQVNFGSLEAGVFLFNHTCKGTLAIHAHEFKDLSCGPMYKERATGGEECQGHCLHEDDLGPCPARCECAYVRDILQIVRQWPKPVEAVMAEAD